ncbi:MAG: hypothetical protein QM775_34165 [Pirellulales bacterium]
MIQDLLNEYASNAIATTTIDYADRKSVQRFNSLADRMRTIADEVVDLGQDAVVQFVSLLDAEPAAPWAAVHLVEKAELDPETLSRCFSIVEKTKAKAESQGNIADAMIKEMWLKEWKKKKM